MSPILFKKSASSLKVELIIAGSVVAALFFMPVVVLASVANMGALSTHSLYNQPVVLTDTYDYGFCTYWVALRRLETGQPIPYNWGNADTWDDNARRLGYQIDHSPSVGAIMQTDAGPQGHVAYVEAVSATGSWTISEMNFYGWDILDSRTMPALAATSYNFIH